MFWIIIIHKPRLCPRPSLLVHFQRLLLLFSHATYCVLNIQNPWSSTCLSSSVDTWKNSNTLLIYFTISVTKYSGKKKVKGERTYSRSLFTGTLYHGREVKDTWLKAAGHITSTLREWEFMLLLSSISLFMQHGILCREQFHPQWGETFLLKLSGQSFLDMSKTLLSGWM